MMLRTEPDLYHRVQVALYPICAVQGRTVLTVALMLQCCVCHCRRLSV